MKRILSLAIALILMIAVSETLSVRAENQPSSKTVVLQKRKTQDSPAIRDIVIDPEGRRVPSKPIMCTINANGIEIGGVNPTQIFQYDICDLDGNCLVSFSSEPEFVEYILSSTEEIEIVLYTEDYIYFGCTFE